MSPAFSIAGPAVELQLGAHFVGDDVCERGLAETRRAGEQHVIECFATIARGFHVDAQVLFDLPLADVFVDTSRAQREIELPILVAGEDRLSTCADIDSARHV